MVGPDTIADEARRLYAIHGIENVSLRQIATAAGLSNPFSAQYHFGDRQGLVYAIYAKRLPEIDACRASLLAEFEGTREHPTLEHLFDCLCRPFKYEFRDYAQFLAWILRYPEQFTARADLDHLAPTTSEIVKRIKGILSYLSEDVVVFRLTVACVTVLDLLAVPERSAPTTLAMAGVERRYSESLAVALGCLAAPRPAHDGMWDQLDKSVGNSPRSNPV